MGEFRWEWPIVVSIPAFAVLGCVFTGFGAWLAMLGAIYYLAMTAARHEDKQE